MSRWFRHYAGMMRDDKLVRAALQAKQPIERVLWVYGVILESAAEIDDGGRYDVDFAEMSYFLRASEEDIAAIADALRNLGRIDDGFVAKWGERQFQSDRSAERQKRHRERHKQSSDGTKEGSDGVVTPLSRHGDAPETETETETEKKKDIRAVKDRTDADFEEFWKIKPSRGKGANPKAPALKAYRSAVRKGADPKQINGAARRWALDEPKPGTEYVAMAVTWLNQQRFDDYKPPPDDAVSRAHQDELMRSRGFEWRNDRWTKIEGGIHEKVCG